MKKLWNYYILTILVVIIFLLFFYFDSYADSTLRYSYLYNVSVSGGKLVTQSSSESQNVKAFIIPMEDVLSNEFYMDFTESNFTGNVSFERLYFSDNYPEINNSVTWGKFTDVKKVNSRTDITSVLHESYDNKYNYMILFCFGYKSQNALDYLYIGSPALDPTPSPDPVPSPDNSDDGDLVVYAGSDSFIWGSDQYPSWPYANYSFSSSVWEHYFDDRDNGTSVVGTYCVFPVRIPFWIEINKDGSYEFDVNFNIDQFDINVNEPSSGLNVPIINKSSPYIDSSESSISWTASYINDGLSFNVYNVPVQNKISPTFYLCFDVVVSYAANYEYSKYFDKCDISCYNMTFNIRRSTVVSNNSNGLLGDINDNIIKGNEQDKQWHDEEIEETERAIDNMTDSVGQLTDTLSSWEILTLPFKVTKDLIDAITNYEGDTGITFPSFTLLDHQLWPSYTFDLKIIEEKFPLLIQALHTITGIIIVGWFIHYCLYKAWAYDLF